MKILTKEKCHECSGEGVIRNAFYDELDAFIKEHRMNHNGESPTVEEEDAWLKTQGFEYWPNEELGCEDCGGAGEVQQWIELEELAQSLSKFLTQPGMPQSIQEALNSGDGVYRP